MSEEETNTDKILAEAMRMSGIIEADIVKNPKKYRVLTGDRPTGRLHIGHYFGSLRNRVRLSRLGVPTMILIADYQVLTDHDAFDKISQNTKELVIDYLAAGIEPGENVCIYPHSHVPEANQLMIPFLTLVSKSDLDRNPTVKDEMAKSSVPMNAGMYTYPVHQAVDILFCKGNVVPVGKDQLPHIEIARLIARRFNNKFCPGERPIFPEPHALLPKSPTMIMGLDGNAKMSKSLGNAITLSASEDETAALIKKAKTDQDRRITYDPAGRPEVANLLRIISLCTDEPPESIAERIGDGGGGALKKELTEALNEHLRPLRARRAELEGQPELIRKVLEEGVERARAVARVTLEEVRHAMNMDF